MPSKAFQDYHRSLVSVYRLIEAHDIVKGEGPGKRALDHFTRSIILILAASWETYIEELIVESANFLSRHTIKITDLPEKVVQSLVKGIDNNKISELFSPDWKEAYNEYIYCTVVGDASIKKWGLNTPKPDKINDLFKKLIGFEENISSYWRHESDVLRFMELRGSFAHRSKVRGYHKIEIAKNYLNILNQVVRETDIQVLYFLWEHTFYQPWNYTYNK